jgi:hypothetical protein
MQDTYTPLEWLWERPDIQRAVEISRFKRAKKEAASTSLTAPSLTAPSLTAPSLTGP